MSGGSGAFLVTWAQTRINGRPAGPVAALHPGVRWEWSGQPREVLREFNPTAPDLTCALARMAPNARFCEGTRGEEPVIECALTLSDGHRVYDALLVEFSELSRPAILFVGQLPPQRHSLSVQVLGEADLPAFAEAAAQVIPLRARAG